jgi:hypothetical protein
MFVFTFPAATTTAIAIYNTIPTEKERHEMETHALLAAYSD